MKKVSLLALLGLFSWSLQAQNVVNDSVSLGAGYAQQAWYGLESGQTTAIDKYEWDIAFPIPGMSVALRINDGGGVHLWKYPNGDQTSWSTIDTSGLANFWSESYNSEDDWDFGAFNALGTNNQFDYGWGHYDLSDHHVRANSVFIIELADGTFKKIIIDDFDSRLGIYHFRHADLNGANEVNDSLKLRDYSGKNFVYYSLSNSQFKDLEPLKSDWDLLLSQYTTFIPSGPDTIAYLVTGVLANVDEGLIKAAGVEANSYISYQNHAWDSARNVIGYNWKVFDGASGSYQVIDSTVYFLMDKAEDIWKIIFTGFNGTTGTFYFSKEKLETNAIKNSLQHEINWALYPNPSNGGDFQIAINLANASSSTALKLRVYDPVGRMVSQRNLELKPGMNRFQVATNNWVAGTYFVSIITDQGSVSQKIIIQ